MNLRRFKSPFLLFASLSLVGCGNVFSNIEERAGTGLGQENAPDHVGIPAVASVTVTPSEMRPTILSFDSIEAPSITKIQSISNEISIHAALRSESEEFSDVHLHELDRPTPENGVISLESSLGCSFTIGNPGTPRAFISALTGSCVNTVAVQLPDQELPRTFLGTTPRFSGRIELADLKAVFESTKDAASLASLLKIYVARLDGAEKPVKVDDLSALLGRLGDDSRRIAAVALLAPRISDAKNAEGLPASSFANTASRDRAIRVLLGYR